MSKADNKERRDDKRQETDGAETEKRPDTDRDTHARAHISPHVKPDVFALVNNRLARATLMEKKRTRRQYTHREEAPALHHRATQYTTTNPLPNKQAACPRRPPRSSTAPLLTLPLPVMTHRFPMSDSPFPRRAFSAKYTTPYPAHSG